MTIEFRTLDTLYKGPILFPNGTNISHISLYNDSLPEGTDSGKLGLARELTPGRGRYVVDPTSVRVGEYNIILVGGNKTPVEITIGNESFRGIGIEVYFSDELGHHKGKIHPK